MLLAYLLVSFAASVAGAICGIGGGVIIKPVLDLVGLDDVSAISFLSGCTVLSMSCYSVLRSLRGGEKRVDARTATPLALGAAAGGVLGKSLFQIVKDLFANQSAVGAVQSVCLALVTVGTLIYTLCKSRIPTRHMEGVLPGTAIGLVLGIMSSFLGIGGGPINLVVLFYFFSMDTKTAAANSLYIILFSQAASLISTLITRSAPAFRPAALVCMVCGGIAGGIAGRALNRRMDERAVDRLFVLLMAGIVLLSACNAWRYAAA